MSQITCQVDADGNPVVQTQSGAIGSADVNVTNAVAIDPQNNAVTLAPNPNVQGPLNATTAAYAASLFVKNSAGIVYGITGYNSKASSQFIQLHDSATLPAEGAVPKITFTVAATSNFGIEFGDFGRKFANGVYAVNSSTGPTKTIGSADVWFDVQYL